MDQVSEPQHKGQEHKNEQNFPDIFDDWEDVIFVANVIMGICRYCFWWVRFNFLQPMLRFGLRGPKGQERGTNLYLFDT